jgi:predicted nucleotidyltransferase
MRIDPKGIVAGYPALQVRRALKQLDLFPDWDLRRFELATGEGRAFLRSLVAAGLVERVKNGCWSITQAGKTLSSATAAPRVTRATAEKNLAAFLGRVDHVNRSAGFLGRVVTVVLFGSMLRPEVDRVSDVDLAVEITPKEPNKDRASALNERDVQAMESLGRRFRGFLDRQFYWRQEVFRFLKGRSRVISLADLKAEGGFVMAAPHRILYANGAWTPDAPPRTKVPRLRRRKLADDDLF